MKYLHPIPGETVICNGKNYLITHNIDLESVIGKDTETGEPQRLRIKDLLPAKPFTAEPAPALELSLVADADWNEAQRRYAIIKPLVEVPHRTRKMVSEHGRKHKVGTATLYRWLDTWRQEGRVSALIPTKPNGGRGKGRLVQEVETVIKSVIDDAERIPKKPSLKKTVEEIQRLCRNAGLPEPGHSTVRNRIMMCGEQDRFRRKHGKRAAAEQFTPRPSHFPDADWPLSVIQIDHTLLDIILVDDIYREPVGRPWVTLAIDVFSRMVAGLYISFDPPGALSTGLCLAHAILPKDKWLAKFDIANTWPLWGKMKKIHADNAKEFRGEMLRRACLEHDIDLEWRPVATPNYGGHIERLLGTFLKEIHTLPGTTFSSPQQRGEYDSEAKAAFTLSEFEQWLAHFITGVYHQRIHSSIKTSPLKKYEEGIFGTPDRPGVGIQSVIVDEERLRLDFMPIEERTIQQYGVVIDYIHYYSDVLRPYVNATGANSRNKRRFVFKRDPRDISVIWFYDEEQKQYSAIPYRDTSHPPISIWELRQIIKRLEDEGRTDIDERLIFATYETMRELEARATKQTKATRRTSQRRVLHQQVQTPFQKEAVAPTQKADIPTIKPFEEMELLGEL